MKLNAAAKKAQAEYQDLYRWVRSQPQEEQWQYGRALRQAAAKFQVEREAAQACGN